MHTETYWVPSQLQHPKVCVRLVDMHTEAHLVPSRLQRPRCSSSCCPQCTAAHRSRAAHCGVARQYEASSGPSLRLLTAFVPPPTGLFPLAVAHALAVLALGMIPSTRHIDSRTTAHVAGGVHRHMRPLPGGQHIFTCRNHYESRSRTFFPDEFGFSGMQRAGLHSTGPDVMSCQHDVPDE